MEKEIESGMDKIRSSLYVQRSRNLQRNDQEKPSHQKFTSHHEDGSISVNTVPIDKNIQGKGNFYSEQIFDSLQLM